MLIDRLRTSGILIGIIAALLYCDWRYTVSGAEGIWLLPLLLFASLGTASDISQLLISSGRPIRHKWTMSATLLVVLSACVPMLWLGAYPADCPVGRLGWIVIGAVGAVFVILIGEMCHYGLPLGADGRPNEESKKGTIERTCAGVFVSLYVGLPMALLVPIRCMNADTHGSDWGLAALVTMIAVTKSTDAGAYFSGKAFGRHKLITRLSPGKTIEGAVGGIVTATIVAFVFLQWIFPCIVGTHSEAPPPPPIPFLNSPIWGALVLGPVLAVSGMIGDLAESLVKRDSGAKDSGNWLPGLGGVWDVTDSLIAAIMPAFLCFAAGIGC